MVLGEMTADGHEYVGFFADADSGLEAIVAIHDTRLGPAVGGTRMLPYESEADALTDALGLARAMAYKTAALGVEFGGGKAVIIGDPDRDKTPELLHAYGRAVDTLGGLFLTGEDVNINTDDVRTIGEVTPHVGGTKIGELADVTAVGVLHGIRACLAEATGDDAIGGRTVLVQGCGKVGSRLVNHLVDNAADVKVADIDAAALDAVTREYRVEAVPAETCYAEPCDVFAPCALGGVITDETVGELACAVVAGSANNVLEHRGLAADLDHRGIVYAPDYVINSGGLIAGVAELEGGRLEDAYTEAARIADRLEEVFDIARREGVSMVEAADQLAERRMAAAGKSLIFRDH